MPWHTLAQPSPTRLDLKKAHPSSHSAPCGWSLARSRSRARPAVAALGPRPPAHLVPALAAGALLPPGPATGAPAPAPRDPSLLACSGAPAPWPLGRRGRVRASAPAAAALGPRRASSPPRRPCFPSPLTHSGAARPCPHCRQRRVLHRLAAPARRPAPASTAGRRRSAPW